MRIATYNVNGINGRLQNLLAWLAETEPDVVCLQELKAPEERFPELALKQAGYGAIWHGQSRWNGVAILARGRTPIEIRRGLPGDRADIQSRYVEAAVSGVIVASLYAPNGNPQPGPKFDYKLAWLDRLRRYAGELLSLEVPVVLAGDYNVAPTDIDIYPTKSWDDDALIQPESRAAFQALRHLGLSDAGELGGQPPGTYTFWDYQAGAWQRDHGIRIDFHLLSPQAADRFQSIETHRDARDMDKPSDHVPVVVELED